MHHLTDILPVFGTLGVVALLAGPLARLLIVLGAWLLELLARWILRGQATGLTPVAHSDQRTRGRDFGGM